MTVHVLKIGVCKDHYSIAFSSVRVCSFLDDLLGRMASKMRFVRAIVQTQTDICLGPSLWGQDWLHGVDLAYWTGAGSRHMSCEDYSGRTSPWSSGDY